MSIRVSEEELEKLKKAAELQEYASYSEFVRRTALMEASRIIKANSIGKTVGFFTDRSFVDGNIIGPQNFCDGNASDAFHNYTSSCINYIKQK